MYLSTKPYKGTRDFYPTELAIRNYIFEASTKVVQKFGFLEIDAPIIEPLDIYLAKTSEEIVNTQIYSFKDRGNRSVAIRPEMTPTVARLLAKKYRELTKPIKWYSTPNVWRYEQPSKGRLREHWQLNCDIFASQSQYLADIEIIQLIIEIMLNFGASHQQFSISIHHRQILEFFLNDVICIPKSKYPNIARILDKKKKNSPEDFNEMLKKEGLSEKDIFEIKHYIEDGIKYFDKYPEIKNKPVFQEFDNVLKTITSLGYEKFIEYDASIIRGFDYYTGIIFEVSDNSPENNRSICGGGRYNNLTSLFQKQDVNAIGFGMGDVTLQNFLETHKLIPESSIYQNSIYLVNFEESTVQIANNILAQELRKHNLRVNSSLSSQKVGRQLQEAESKGINFAIIQGQNEIDKNIIYLKNIKDRTQEEFSKENLIQKLIQISNLVTK